ncbi:hypothetical protein [Sandaracinus amylolyticus]|uniref:hypothetical protein n=1 Tax=Sandaracinus amylolyticus TaxID=927083 RepID=UPI001F457EF9|nr:hypothetical protein [Sandaracinus amylolyticus]UJR82550.1 Hypothetical protein I5071_46150 [Sandaracinus amylolyticus]
MTIDRPLRTRLASCLGLALALAACEGDPRATVSLGDGGVGDDSDAAIGPRSLPAIEDPSQLFGGPPNVPPRTFEQEAEPVRALFVEESDLALGRAWDPTSRGLGERCVRGAEVLMPDPAGGVASWASNRAASAEDLGFAAIPIGPEMTPPAQLEEVLEGMGLELALTEDLRTSARWGEARLADDAERVEGCDGPVVARVVLEQRRFTRLRLAFVSRADHESFVARHPGLRLLDVVMAEGQEREQLERELAGRAQLEVWHIQIGGDRLATEAVLRRHACSVTELAQCDALMSDLERLAESELAAPQPGDRRGWIATRGVAE